MENLELGNTTATDTAGSSSDSASLTGSPAGGVSTAPPVTAESLVDSYLNPSAPSAAPAPVSDETGAGAAVSEAEPNAADSAVSPPLEERGYKSLEDAINDIRGLRENKKALEPKAKGYDELLSKFESIGLNQQLIEPGLELLGGLLATEETADGQMVQTTAPFFDRLEELSQPTLRQLLSDVKSRYPGYMLKQFGREELLQAAGLDPKLSDTYAAVLPDGSLNGSTVGGYDPATLNAIPAELRDTYKSLPLEDQIELDGMSEERRNYKLQQKFEFDEMKRQQSEADTRRAEEQAQRQEAQREQRLNQAVASANGAFMDELRQSFSPFGDDPAKKDLNEFFHTAIFNQVAAQLGADPKTKAMLDAYAEAAKEGDGIATQRLLAQINVHAVKHRNALIEQLNQSVFSPTFAQAQAARAANASHTNVNGTGGFSANHAPAALPAINSPEYYEALLERNGVRF